MKKGMIAVALAMVIIAAMLLQGVGFTQVSAWGPTATPWTKTPKVTKTVQPSATPLPSATPSRETCVNFEQKVWVEDDPSGLYSYVYYQAFWEGPPERITVNFDGRGNRDFDRGGAPIPPGGWQVDRMMLTEPLAFTVRVKVNPDYPDCKGSKTVFIPPYPHHPTPTSEPTSTGTLVPTTEVTPTGTAVPPIPPADIPIFFCLDLQVKDLGESYSLTVTCSNEDAKPAQVFEVIGGERKLLASGACSREHPFTAIVEGPRPTHRVVAIVGGKSSKACRHNLADWSPMGGAIEDYWLPILGLAIALVLVGLVIFIYGLLRRK